MFPVAKSIAPPVPAKARFEVNVENDIDAFNVVDPSMAPPLVVPVLDVNELLETFTLTEMLEVVRTTPPEAAVLFINVLESIVRVDDVPI